MIVPNENAPSYIYDGFIINWYKKPIPVGYIWVSVTGVSNVKRHA